ncbi:MAG: YebC/PmpR family DNA-binding transcriptional regulator [Clostridiales bacterium]|nr:YebC/PmpR family DNA-binding transcriptional regulator [Clostridiales bacterium]
MSGHSKWANIKHKKGKTDDQRGKIFTKLGREIAISVRQGGADPESNSHLKDVIAKAKTSNMPNDNILRSIKKATGEGSANLIEVINYEGYGPGGIAMIVEAMTENRNRTAGDVRHFFDKFGGNLGSTGCVSFLFEKKGVILIENEGSQDEEELMLTAIEAGVDDFNSFDEYFEILTSPADFSRIRELFEKKRNLKFLSASVEMVPLNTSKLTDTKQAEMMEKLIEYLEDLEDVQNVYHNWEQE